MIKIIYKTQQNQLKTLSDKLLRTALSDNKAFV
jgi:hypothetical protein